MKMIKVCGKMLSEVRLEKNWGTPVDERVIYYKILNFQGNLENSMLSKFSLCCT